MSRKNTNVTVSGGVGFTGLLTIVFVVLKLTGYIDWSWFWVTFPFWAIPAFVCSLLLVFLLATGTFKAVDGILKVVKGAKK